MSTLPVPEPPMPDFNPRKIPLDRPLTRRSFLGYGGALGGAAVAMSSTGALWRAASAYAKAVRVPGSLPDPRRPAGTATEALPFDHIVVVMMENHSFDNLLGALPRFGQRKAHGLKFDHAGVALNSNPGPEGPVG
ncbi:MAG TPA: alkaline phosphatase family protein, partial [Solirubrobacteraceae bacterium]